MHAIVQGQLHATHGKKPRAFALLRSLCPAWREGLSSLTKGAPKEETLHEEQPLFGTENKIFQDLRYYT